MRVVLLGGGGFIGSHLAEWLLQRGTHEVVATDISHTKVRHLLGLSKFTYFDSDLHNDHVLTEQLVASADVVVNLVAVATPKAYITNPLHVFELDFLDNLRVAQLCAKTNRRLIQFSTCEVYGPTWLSQVPPELATPEFISQSDITQSEDSTALIAGPIQETRWIYATSKHLLERVIHALGVHQGLDYSVIRPFNFIGPRFDFLPSEKGDDSPRMFAQFMDALLHGTDMSLVDGGLAQRCYTYIDDAVECIGRVVEDASGVSSRQIFNVGNPSNEASVAEFAELMLQIYRECYWDGLRELPEMVSVSSQDFFGPGYADCDRRIPDISKARALLGWEPLCNLPDLVTKTMKSFVEDYRARELSGAQHGLPPPQATP
jgi:UDP-apiose/xylose synthase